MVSGFSSTPLIRHRLLMAFIGLAVVPLLLAGSILAWHTRSFFLHNISLVQHERAKHIVSEFAGILRSIEQEMVSVQRYRNFLTLNLSGQKRVLEELLASRDIFEEILFIDEACRIRACVSNTHLECDPDPRILQEVEEWFRQAKASSETFFGPVGFETGTGIPVMPVVVPLLDFRSGQVQGALFANVKLSRVGQAVGRIPLQDGEDIFIIGARNRVVAHGNPTTVLKGNLFFPDQQQGIQEGLHGETAVVAVERVSLGGQEFRVIVEHRVKEALRSLYVNILLLVVLLFAALLGSFALAGLTDKQIFVPLAELRAIAAEFVDGNYSKRLPLPRGRELADLASTFNLMADNLQRTLSDIALENKERRQAEEALRKSEERFRDLTENTSDWIWEFDENETFTYASPRVKDLLGYEPDEVVGKSAFFLMADEEARQVSEEFLAMKEARQPFTNLENINLRKDGTPVVIESSGIPIFDANGEFRGYRGIDRDIMERKKAQEKIINAHTLLNSLIDSIPDFIVYKDQQGVYLGCNEAFARLVQKNKEEVVGSTDYDLFDRELADFFRSKDQEMLASGRTLSNDESVVLPDGRMALLDTLKTPYYGPEGDIIGLIGISRDVTDRKEAEEKIQASLEEKEVLLKEVHHRVKNNLQIISSLFFLQIQKTLNQEAVAVLVESQNRLKSMALIHEKLYQSEDLAKIDFADYLQSLVKRIFQSYGSGMSKVQFFVEAEHVQLPVDLAIPCGLVVNELVTNSFKHAFGGKAGGELCISFSCPDGRCLLSVKDNGVGLPDAALSGESQSLGMTLISKLVGQMDGSYEFLCDDGTECRILFSA